MEIRKLEAAEHSNTKPLYKEIFSEDSQSFVDYYYTEKTKDNQIYVVEEDSGIQAMLHLNPYTLMVNGLEKETHYIVAVATREAYRKRGFMAALMKKALCDMYKSGETFTFLMPAAESIYLPHDFRTVYEQEKRTCASEKTVQEEEITICPANPADAGVIAEAAEACLSRHYQVYAKRDEAYYTRLMKELESDGGKLMLYKKGEKITDCRFFYEEDENPSGNPKIMVRIVDVRRMLMSVKVRTLTAACFTVTDPLIEENNRCVVITGTEFSGIMLMDGKPENSEGTIPVAALGSFLFGAESVEELGREKGVEMSERLAGELEKIVPLSKIYLNETV